MADDLAEGNLFMEVQISAWPPPVTQTLLRKSDGRLGLTIRAKPSGRLRVELLRQGYEPVVVRSLHLNMRAPTLLRLNIIWRSAEAAVAANGQIVGTSGDVYPEGFVTPTEIQETEALTDHVDNERARAFRRQRTEAARPQLDPDDAQYGNWFASLAMSSQVLADLVELAREGRRHHLPGLMSELAHLIVGSERDEPLLQWCAGMADAPLLVYASMALPARDSDPVTVVCSALDIAPVRGEGHELAVDLDVWLRYEMPWPSGHTIPVAGLLSTIAEALTPLPSDRARPGHLEAIRAMLSQPNSRLVDVLCRFALTICQLSAALRSEKRAEPAPVDVAA